MERFAPKEPVILYILDTFPSLTETFILREIVELKKRGIQLRILAFRRDSSPLIHDDAKDLQNEVSYVPSLRCFSNVFHVVLYAITHPVAAVQAFLTFLTDLNSGLRFAVQRLKAVLKSWLVQKWADSSSHYHAHFAYVAADLARALSLLTGKSWSLSVHAWDIFTQNDQIISRRIADAERIYCCSKHAYNLMAERFAQCRDKLDLVYHGVDTEQFIPASEATASRQFLAICRLEPKKGFDTLVRACGILHSESMDFVCRIVGDGEEKDNLHQLIDESNLQDIVLLSGKATMQEVISFYRESIVLVLPCRPLASGDHDGLPNVILEAQAMELPVISTAVGGIPEFLETGKNGLMVPYDDPVELANAMKTLLTNTDTARKLGQNGRRKVLEQFTIHETVKPLSEYFAGKLAEKDN